MPDADTDIENGHLEPVNSPSQAAAQAITDAAQESPKPATEVKAPFVDANAAASAHAAQFVQCEDAVLAEIPTTTGKERVVEEVCI